MNASARLDAVIIGAGHNGLTCACYLAAAGLKVAVYERNEVVGGAAQTEEFHPGFRNSVAAYTVSLLHPQVIRDLSLHQHGLRIRRAAARQFSAATGRGIFEDGRRLEATRTEVARYSSARCRAAYPLTTQCSTQVSNVLRGLVLRNAA